GTILSMALSLHDALPISLECRPELRAGRGAVAALCRGTGADRGLPRERASQRRTAECLRRIRRIARSDARLPARLAGRGAREHRSEEHTSELQSRENIVC